MTSTPMSWKPSTFGKFFTRSPAWELFFVSGQYQLLIGGQKLEGPVCDLERVRIAPGAIWSAITCLPIAGGSITSLDGIPNAQAKDLEKAIAQAVWQIRIAELIENFDHEIQPAAYWASGARGASKAQLAAKGWLTHEFKQTQSALKPNESPRELRRLHFLREWSHEQDEQIFPGSQRACRTTGAGGAQGSAIAMGSRRVDSADDWMFNGHVARVGQETRSRYWRT